MLAFVFIGCGDASLRPFVFEEEEPDESLLVLIGTDFLFFEGEVVNVLIENEDGLVPAPQTVVTDGQFVLEIPGLPEVPLTVALWVDNGDEFCDPDFDEVGVVVLDPMETEGGLQVDVTPVDVLRPPDPCAPFLSFGPL